MKGATDEVLISRVAETGDGRALSELYDRYSELIYSAGVRYLGDRAHAEDLVQDVFLSVWRNAASFDASRAGFSTWVYRITRNRATDLARRRGARVRTVSSSAEGAFPEPGEGDGTEETLRMFDVVGALSGLSAVHREVLVLAYFGGLSQREISNRTDTPLGTVNWARSRAAPPPPCAPHAKNFCLPRSAPTMGERRNQGGNPDGDSRDGHAWTRELLGPYVLGVLEAEEEKAVERHLEGCAACRDEERGLRETHERLAGASIADASVPPDLKTRVLDAPDALPGLPGREGSELAREDVQSTLRGALPGARRAGQALAAVAMLLLLALGAVVYSADLLGQPAETATLAPTDLAPESGGALEVRGSGRNTQASLEVWGLPETGPDEYYELWLGREGGRVSVGIFAVGGGGRRELSSLCPEVVGGYERAGITLERFPEEPRMDSARVVLCGDLQGS